MATISVPAGYYQHFDVDPNLDVPTEGYGGWKKASIPLALDHTAVVVMHAWNCHTPERYPGWHRCAEWIPRATGICRTVFPPLLSAVRQAGIPLFHVVSQGTYYKHLAGYKLTLAVAGPEPPAPERIDEAPELAPLFEFRRDHVFVGAHNRDDVTHAFAELDFAPEARPLGSEPVAETSHQLVRLCRATGISHLIYAGFCLDGCLLLSPGGMVDMGRSGLMCSAFRQAVTAIEHKETARHEMAKEVGLWRVALMYGFVFDVDDFLAALRDGEERQAGPPYAVGESDG